MSNAQPPILLAYGFRPFFLLTGAYATVVVLGWVGFLFGDWALPLGWSPMKWHSHEMLYGLVPAAIAGFLLTAVTNWTGAKPLAGGKLLSLILLWLAGRAVMWMASWLPGTWVAAVDLAFLPIVGIYMARVLLKHGNKRNLILVAVLALMTLGNVLMHWGFLKGSTQMLNMGEQLGFNLIILMMVVIAGRITPAFTANWLSAQGKDPERVTRSAMTDKLAMFSVALLIPLEVFLAPSALIGASALLAAGINGVRLLQWSGWSAAREPLLWVLHIAYLFIVLALLIRGLGVFASSISDSVWQHTLGLGGIGLLILGVMTRVAVGHTGRPLKLVRFGLLTYLALIAATVLRTGAALQWFDYRISVTLAAIAWVLAFSLFVVLYWPILSQPRADGRTG